MNPKPSLVFLVFIFLTLAPLRTHAQTFPYDDFLPRTLKGIVDENIAVQARSLRDVKTKRQIIIDADPLPSVVRVTYTGKTRPLVDERKNYLNLWISSMGKDAKFIDLYDLEMMVVEGSTQYWIPFQKQLRSHFEHEISENTPVDLYLIRLGGILTKQGWDWMFLVEEFRKPGTDNPAIFPWNDFAARSIEQIAATSVQTKAVPPSDQNSIFFDTILSSKVRLTYSGKSRPTDGARAKFIQKWVAAFGTDPAYARLYELEFLFTEGQREYWIPVAKPILVRFEKEVTVGSAVDLYVIRLGGTRSNGKIDWILLAEEFQKATK